MVLVHVECLVFLGVECVVLSACVVFVWFVWWVQFVFWLFGCSVWVLLCDVVGRSRCLCIVLV